MLRREKQREWRAANPGKIKARLERERKPPVELVCAECEETFMGRPHARLFSRQCKDRRSWRLHPEQVRAKERRKRKRRRAKELV